MTSEKVKEFALNVGAHVCGVASVNRFTDAPVGFHPNNLLPGTQTAVAFAKQVPKSMLNLPTKIPYSLVETMLLHETHMIAYELVLFLESKGYKAVVVPSEPYQYWDGANRTGKGLVSLKHIAYNAGLGAWGKNHLLYNPRLGNLMKIGAVLTNAALEPDEILTRSICKPNCSLCFKSCPSGALTETGVVQSKCRANSQGKTPKGDEIYTCNACRQVCPNLCGFDN